MTVADLIAHLQEQPQEMLVAYNLHSEHCLLELGDIHIAELGQPRPDGWVHSRRPDKPSQTYLLLPGN